MMDMPLQFNMEKMGRSMPANNAGMEDMGRQGHEVSTSSDIRVGAGDGMMQSQMMGMMGGSVGMGPMSGGQMAGSMGPMTPGPMAGSMGSMTGGQMAGSMGPMTGMGYQGAMNMMGPDANMMMMGPMGYNQYGGYDMNQMGMGCPPEFLNKEIIELKCGMLYPPPPGSRPRSRREKPSGCRTVFVGSLPDGVTEENIYEIFDRFGNIVSVRLNKNNYCHIRYEFQDSVEYALLLSGYTLKMEEDGEGVRSKHLHVDYAHARDDQYEWECLQRALEREKRHRQRIEDSLRPPSPPPVTRFSEGEAQIILEKLKSDESFGEGSSTLLAWLSRGEVNRRSANVFYSLLQSTNAHVRALVSEKENREHEMENLKASFRLQIQGILNQFDHIENVFVEAQKQRAFDHFSKAQRKSIDLWCKQVQEIKRAEQEKFLSERKEDEMEMSDTDMDEDDGPTSSKRKKLDQASQQQLYEVREENDSLRCQLEAYRNDLDVQKHDWQKQLGDKDSQLRVLQQALQGMQQQLISFRQQAQEDKKKSIDSTPNKTTTDNLESEKETPSEKDDNSCAEKEKAASSVDTSQEHPSTEHPTKKSDTPENLNSSENLKSPEKPKTPEKRKASVGSNDDPLQSKVVQEAMAFAAKQLEKQKSVEPVTSQPEIPSSSTTIALSEKETKIIGLVSCFLHVHPFGASTDYLWSYLQRLNLFCRPSEIEDLMDRLPMLYRIEMFGVGASLERRWKFIGYSGFN